VGSIFNLIPRRAAPCLYTKQSSQYSFSADTGVEIILKTAAKLYNRIEDILQPNRAADLSALSAYERAAPFFTYHWTGPRSQCLSLNCLGVDPNYQGRGHGRELVQWGLNQAASESIAASVVSSCGNEGFYKKCGFEVEVGTVSEGQGNPLSGVRGGTILFKNTSSDVYG
jgi:GNAT superfamily N-acetyltransferase